MQPGGWDVTVQVKTGREPGGVWGSGFAQGRSNLGGLGVPL